jgi:esterase/lipase superfamily enzyme
MHRAVNTIPLMKKLTDSHVSISGFHYAIPVYFLIAVFLAGCASQTRHLMPVPNLYIGEDAPKLFTTLPAELQDNQVDLLYVTDRTPATDNEGGLTYGHGRSHSAAFGSVIVAIEPEMAWDELQRVSLERDRSTQLSLRLVSLKEHGRFPETPQPVVLINDEAQPDPIALEKLNITEQSFQKEVRRRLALASKPEILLFVHGYNNNFEYAAQTLAELWHFFGREHVPILYSWPAGKGGASGYIYDRESGEFTVFHLKNLLRSLAGITEITTFHLIAHSRGTDVLSSAVRELALVARAEGEKAPDKLQVSHLILAAPDLDLDVVSQRILAEQLGREIENITIYTSQGDKAIGLAERMFKSATRMGRLSIKDLETSGLESMDNIEGVSFVDLKESAGGTGHSYFHSDPAASSDMILMVRYGLSPGAGNGRPLKSIAPGFWQIEGGYPSQQGGEK